MSSGIKVPQTILKLRKGMGSPVSFDPQNCTSIINTHNEMQYFLSPYFSGIKIIITHNEMQYFLSPYFSGIKVRKEITHDFVMPCEQKNHA